jgi:A/G-specific adenine glycosylase
MTGTKNCARDRRRLPTAREITAFQNEILEFYAEHGRDLPFRRTTDPYRITVSEFMLHQTQVERVVPKYEQWVVLWPDWQSLSSASRRNVLAAWSGLGYNRRAIYLRECARKVTSQYDSQLPRDPELLETLPGIGPYTARAILIFAFNEPLAAIDTNIRRVLLHSFRWPSETSPTDLKRLAEKALYANDPRRWHYALMDYSRLALPKLITSIPPLSRQSRFEGSIRQIRGEIIRRLTLKKSVRRTTIARSLNRSAEDVDRAIRALQREGLVTLVGQSIRLRDD